MGVPGEWTDRAIEKPSEKLMRVAKLGEVNESSIQGAQMNSKQAKAEETYATTHCRQTVERQ